MSMVSKSWEVLRNRPTLVYPYARQTFKFYFTRVLLGMLKPRGIELGQNVRVQSFSSLRVEVPASRIQIGDHSIIWETCKIEAVGGGDIRIGPYCELDGVTVACKQEIRIGSHTGIASGTFIQDYLGHPTDPEERKRERQMRLEWFSPRFGPSPASGRIKREAYDQRLKAISIGSNVMIYRHCLIAKGVTIGDNCVIGAYSVVTRDIPPDTFAAGNPAAVVRRL